MRYANRILQIHKNGSCLSSRKGTSRGKGKELNNLGTVDLRKKGAFEKRIEKTEYLAQRKPKTVTMTGTLNK